MSIASEYRNNVLIVYPKGEWMGGPEAEEFRKIIDEALQRGVVNAVVDMKEVTWMNSSGQGVLVGALAKLRSSGGELKLANLSERVRRPLRLTRLDSVFEEYDGVEEALKTFPQD